MKRPCDLDGIEQYLILQGEKDGSCYTVKVVPIILSNVGINEKTAWDTALENLSADTQLTSLEKVRADMMGAQYDGSMDPDIKFHVITNPHKCKGAACIMNQKTLRTFIQKYDTNMLFVLPSTVHEMMIAPYSSNFKLQDQKLKEGKDLIRYFCSPCKPTKSNGGRTRNLPQHDSEKWIRFKEYNRRDVEVGMAIKKRLAKYPVPDFIWDEYHLNDAPDPVQRGYVVFLHIPPDALYDLHRGIRVMEVRRPHRDCGCPA